MLPMNTHVGQGPHCDITVSSSGHDTASERAVLLNPGPVLVHEQVRQALTYPDVCHREPEVADLMTRARWKATRVCGGGDTFTSVLLAGSGTAALEVTLSSIVPADSRMLILDNGNYGERLHRIAAVHGIDHERMEFGWTTPVGVAAVNRVRAADPAITHVAMVHHETSTGMLNPIREVRAVVARHWRSLAVDAISSLGAEELDVRADHVDWCVSTANKCLEGLPGVSLVCARRAALDAIADVPARSFYLDLHSHHVAERAPAERLELRRPARRAQGREIRRVRHAGAARRRVPGSDHGPAKRARRRELPRRARPRRAQAA